MHPDNVFYGHRDVLGAYLGTETGPIRAHLQHGWAPFCPVSRSIREIPKLPFLAWAQRDADVLSSIGVRNVDLIGAPFLYLRHVLGLDDDLARGLPGDGSMLVYPTHGLERQEVGGDHDRYVAEISERATGPVTVVLYWVEFGQQAVRRRYEEAGFRVTCHGLREDPAFLWRQVEEMLRHDIVSANAVMTALWYGASLGRNVSMFGPPATTQDAAYLAEWARYLSAKWPELSGDGMSGSHALEAGEAQLGLSNRRSPGELAELLGTARGPVGGAERRSFTVGYQLRRLLAIGEDHLRPGMVAERDLRQMRASVPFGD